ncbi:unnamed protein product [Staurois parvus]|uniref:Uncharacterized protein n=1 Tax=Staurois parvus TaxID=386267 RepID=A0ABN9DAW0_9NEOB|nr:unnamed protein product [Staurois parvus]
MEEARAIGKDGWTPFDLVRIRIWFHLFMDERYRCKHSHDIVFCFIFYIYVFKCLLYCIARATKPQNTNEGYLAM